MFSLKKNTQRGFVAIVTVLVITSVIVSIVTTVALLSVGEAQSALSFFKGEENLHFVEGCVEDVLLKIRSNASYNGTTITRPEGTCAITYTSTDPNWNIIVSTTSTEYKRQIRVIFTRSSSGISLTSWREI